MMRRFLNNKKLAVLSAVWAATAGFLAGGLGHGANMKYCEALVSGRCSYLVLSNYLDCCDTPSPGVWKVWTGGWIDVKAKSATAHQFYFWKHSGSWTNTDCNPIDLVCC
jgi:hypothetical protein